MQNKNIGNLATFIFCVSLFFQSYYVGQEDFLLTISLLSIDFVAFYFITQSNFTTKELQKISYLIYLVPFFSFPQLSNDIYRFLWDGELLNQGINPYDFKPNELIIRDSFSDDSYFKKLYQGMGELSQENYSCYPFLNQIYFFIASFCSSNVLFNLIILRLLILISLFFGFKYLKLLLEKLSFPKKRYILFALNPLLVLEVSQNLHFEGVMLSFSIIAFYFLTQKKWLLAGLFFACAIQIKLLPLLFLPFILRSIGWKFSLITWTTAIGITILSSLILLHPSNISNFLQSIQLYFRQFEFNSFILHYYIEYGRMRYGYNRIQTFGPYLSRLAIEFIIILAWFGEFSMQKMFQRLFFAILIYYFLSSTVHPWYILTPLLFGIFTSYKTATLWSMLVFLSYYSYANLDQSYFRIIVAMEYVLLFSFFGYELISANFYKVKKPA